MVIVHRPSNASEHSSDGFNLNANTVEIADSLSDVIHARLLVVGGHGVGKTSLLTNFLGRSSIWAQYAETNVRAIGLKTPKKGVVEKATLQVQDCASQSNTFFFCSPNQHLLLVGIKEIPFTKRKFDC